MKKKEALKQTVDRLHDNIIGNTDLSVEQMRNALCEYEIREHRINMNRTTFQALINIKRWMREPSYKIIIWYNKFFETK